LNNKLNIRSPDLGFLDVPTLRFAPPGSNWPQSAVSGSMVSVKYVRPHVGPEFLEGICGHSASKSFERPEDRVVIVRLAIRPPGV